MASSASAVGVVLVTHGQLAAELLNAAEMIVGDLPRFAAVSIGWHDDVALAHEAIATAIAKVDAGQDWPEAAEAHGGGPILVVASVAKNGATDWASV